ncbi:acetyltransferase [Bradyrhizobium sp.]|uniref:acetyltransferase n=1 Tax=Bradyrhizobium sp. TaxID=376 RepID=UPI003C778E59
MMKNSFVILVGAGGFGREVICWARDARAAGKFPEIRGYLDDAGDTLAKYSYGLPYLGAVTSYAAQGDESYLMGIVDCGQKERIAEALVKKGGGLATLIHPSAVIASSAVIGGGSVVCPHALVSADATVGRLVTINVHSSVGHDVTLGDYCTLSAHVDVTGAVAVGKKVFFGSGATVVPRISIGDGAIIGAGAMVIRSVPEGVTMYAAPARKL